MANALHGDLPWAGFADVEVQGRRLRLTNLDKVLWPETGHTKRDMLAYYEGVSPTLLPYLAGRPLTLKRYPDGVEEWHWFQTECPPHPSWVRTCSVPSATRPGHVFQYCVVDDLASLLWTINLAAIELHPLLGRPGRIHEASAVVFDLDPGPPADVRDCCEVALWLRDLLTDVGLTAVAKTSGLAGLHVYVPLNVPHRFAAVRAFARDVAAALSDKHPERATDRRDRALRLGRVLVDWTQNSPRRSMVAPYSLRAAPVPTASVPLLWCEVHDVARTRDYSSLPLEPSDALGRLRSHGDVFAPVLQAEQSLPLPHASPGGGLA